MTTLAAVVDANTSDDQWEQWIAMGKLRDLRRSKRVTAVATVIACGFALWVSSQLLLV